MTTDPAASGPAPDAGHVDPDTLADLAEGLLTPAAADSVRDHLGTCDRCADDFAHITLDSGLAAFLPPEPIPAEVMARVEAALYREPPLVDPAASAKAAQSARQAARVQRGRRFKLAFGVVGVLGLLGAGGVALSAVVNNSSEKASTSAASGQGRADSNLPGGSPKLAAGDELASVRQQATELLLALGSHGGAATTKSGAPAGGLNSEALKSQCWVDPRPTEKLLTYAPTTYQGQPAELLVYAKAGAPTQAHVVLVPACAQTPDSATSPNAAAPAAPPSGGMFSSLIPARPTILAETDITRP